MAFSCTGLNSRSVYLIQSEASECACERRMNFISKTFALDFTVRIVVTDQKLN